MAVLLMIGMYDRLIINDAQRLLRNKVPEIGGNCSPLRYCSRAEFMGTVSTSLDLFFTPHSLSSQWTPSLVPAPNLKPFPTMELAIVVRRVCLSTG
jgi:hypothetical protein